jgi:hypothetical protein
VSYQILATNHLFVNLIARGDPNHCAGIAPDFVAFSLLQLREAFAT